MGHVTTLAPLPRCPFKGCPVRYRGGPDRLCAEHQHGGGDLLAAARELGIELAPGDRDDDGTDAMA